MHSAHQIAFMRPDHLRTWPTFEFADALRKRVALRGNAGLRNGISDVGRSGLFVDQWLIQASAQREQGERADWRCQPRGDGIASALHDLQPQALGVALTIRRAAGLC